MFNLETEVRRWCRGVTPGVFFRSQHVAELEDHIHCSVAELVKRGVEEERAFHVVTQEIGEVRTLRGEFRKNAGLLANLLDWFGSHPTARFRFAAASICLIVIIGVCLSLHRDLFAGWAENALLALYMIPKNWFGAI